MECRFCGIKLNLDNWYPYQQKINYHICKACNWARFGKPYYEKNRAKKAEYMRLHRAKLREQAKARNAKRVEKIDTVDQTFYIARARLKKPEYCSICGAKAKRIMFHHWLDEPLTGIWVCLPCHNLIHMRTGSKERLVNSIEEWYQKYQEIKSLPIVIDPAKTHRRWKNK